MVEDATAQATVAFSTGGALTPGMLPYALDLEANPNALSPDDMAQWTLQWLRTMQSLSGRAPIVYTGSWFFNTQVTPDVNLAAFPLWTSHYGVDVRQPLVPKPWSTFTFWQYSEKGTAPGVSSLTDLNVFAGTAAELNLLAGRSVPVTASAPVVAPLGSLTPPSASGSNSSGSARLLGNALAEALATDAS